jgi:hypothetical protein
LIPSMLSYFLYLFLSASYKRTWDLALVSYRIYNDFLFLEGGNFARN